MLVDTDVSLLITQLVEQFRSKMKQLDYNYQTGKAKSIGIKMKLNMKLFDYTDNHTFETHEFLTFIFTGNTSVFVSSEADDQFVYSLKPENFANTSNHDSCWRSDGLNILSKKYFEMAERINKQRVEQCLKEIAPIAMRQHNHFGFGNLFELVIINIKLKDTNEYQYDLISVEEVKK